MQLLRNWKEKEDKGEKGKESEDRLHRWNVYRVSRMETNRNRMKLTRHGSNIGQPVVMLSLQSVGPPTFCSALCVFR